MKKKKKKGQDVASELGIVVADTGSFAVESQHSDRVPNIGLCMPAELNSTCAFLAR
jgi:hypothetical protein